MKNKKTIFSFLLICYWIILWGSISSFIWDEGYLYTLNLIDFSKNITLSVNSLRSITALSSSLLIIIYFFFILIFKKVKVEKIHLLFILIFFSQLVGLFLNEERFFNFHYSYLAILGIGTICAFVIINENKLNYIFNYFFWISFFFLTIIFFTTLSKKIPEIENLNFYVAFGDEDTNILGVTNQKITGLSRILALINLSLILYLIKVKNIYFKISYFSFLIFSILILFLMQSRGTLLCFFFSLLVIILFMLKNNLSKIKYFLTLIIIPALIYLFINLSFIAKEKVHNNNAKFENRILNLTSSGRYNIWTYTIKNYNYKKIFGYGPNGDRFFLKNFDDKEKYSDNSSNLIIYSLVSGGIISIMFLALALLELLKFFLNNKKFHTKNKIYHKISIIFVIFFIIRSNFENSFGLFSVDFLLTYLSISYLISSKSLIQNK